MKKKLLVAVLAIAMLGAFAACSITQVSAMAFSVAPAATYQVSSDGVDASQFKVQVDMEDGTSREFELTNSLLTVQGLVNGRLDTSTPGQKTLRISYRGFSFTFTYTVLGESDTTSWADSGNYSNIAVTFESADATVSVASAADLAGFAYKLNNQEGEAKAYTGTLTLTANIDLAGHQWVPINNFAGTFDGGNYTVSNLTIINTDTTEELKDQGLFGDVQVEQAKTATFKNVTLDNIYIEETNTQSMTSKNYGALIGHTAASVATQAKYGTDKTTVTTQGVDGGKIVISNIYVTNASLKGTARLGGIVGQNEKGYLEISDCYVQGSFTAFNPVTVSTADGEGDKVGGIIGQANGVVFIDRCNVQVQLAGTRDIGGIMGYASSGKVSNCSVMSGSTLRASVAGGMLLTKGTRNVGGIIGSVQYAAVLFKADTTTKGDGITYSVMELGSGNTVADDVIMETNDLYDYSNTGKLLGGFRSTGMLLYNGAYYGIGNAYENAVVQDTPTAISGQAGTFTASHKINTVNYNVLLAGDSSVIAVCWNTSLNEVENIEAVMTAQDAAILELETAYGL